MNDWKEVILKPFIEVINGYAFKSKDFINNPKDNYLPVVKIKNVASGEVTLKDVQFHKNNNQYEKYIIKYSDILIALTGNHPQALTQVVGGVSLFKHYQPALLNQRVAIIRAKANLDNQFLYFFLKDEVTQNLLANQSSGSANQANISKSDIENISINLPPLPEQKAIAGVLSSLDDKIDLLHRQNKTLEAMAETLFRQWFIEEAEDDWEIKTLDDILSVRGGSTPSTKEPSYWNGDIYWTSPRDITTLDCIHLFNTERKITIEGLKKISSGVLPNGTLLMSSRAPVGILAFAEIPLAINQGYIAIIDDKGFSKEYIYFWLKFNMDYVHSFANGSTFQEISKSSFKSLNISIPPIERLEEFQNHASLILKKIKRNTLSIKNIERIRGLLLPKLLSGEIKIEE